MKLRYALLPIACGIVVSAVMLTVVLLSGPTRWTASATVVESAALALPSATRISSAAAERHVADLAELAKSRTVLERTAQTLYELDVTSDPNRILETLEITPIEDTNVIRIRVTSEDQEVSRTTVDALAAEFARYYRELRARPGDEEAEGPRMVALDPAQITPAPRSLARRVSVVGVSVVGVGTITFAAGVLVGIAIGLSRRRASNG